MVLFIEILTRDSRNPGLTKPITSERTQWSKPVTSNQTKRAHVQPLRGHAHMTPSNHVSTVVDAAVVNRRKRFTLDSTRMKLV